MIVHSSKNPIIIKEAVIDENLENIVKNIVNICNRKIKQSNCKQVANNVKFYYSNDDKIRYEAQVSDNYSLAKKGLIVYSDYTGNLKSGLTTATIPGNKEYNPFEEIRNIFIEACKEYLKDNDNIKYVPLMIESKRSYFVIYTKTDKEISYNEFINILKKDPYFDEEGLNYYSNRDFDRLIKNKEFIYNFINKSDLSGYIKSNSNLCYYDNYGIVLSFYLIKDNKTINSPITPYFKKYLDLSKEEDELIVKSYDKKIDSVEKDKIREELGKIDEKLEDAYYEADNNFRDALYKIIKKVNPEYKKNKLSYAQRSVGYTYSSTSYYMEYNIKY